MKASLKQETNFPTLTQAPFDIINLFEGLFLFCTCLCDFSSLTVVESFIAKQGKEKNYWFTLFAHVPNYSKGHVAELEACTNINGSRE